MLRIGFLNPPSGLDRDFYEIPLNLAYLVACVRARGLPVEMRVLDMELHAAGDPWAFLEEHGPRWSPDVIAAPLYTYSLDRCLGAILRMKQWHPDCLVVVGGPHATLAPREMLAKPGVDLVVVGEGDDSFVEIIEALLRGRKGFFERIASLDGVAFAVDGVVTQKPRRTLIRDLDRVPLATAGYDLFDLDAVQRAPGFVPMMSSRGCPYRCVFCSSADLWEHRINFRSPENVGRELEEVRRLGFRVVNFRDDMFTIRRRRTIAIAKILGEMGFAWGCETRADRVDEELLRIMVDNGLTTIRFGIESFHQKTLDLLKKEETVEDLVHAIELCGKVGVPEVRNSFMVGLPGETEDDVLATFRIARSYPFTTNRFWAFSPVLGTEIHARMDSFGVKWVADSSKRSSTASIVETDLLSNDQINRLVQREHAEFGHPLTRVHRDLQAATGGCDSRGR
jgi:radical SAM superfamily enzyme YgiQ (UPF0313 family)